jgi:hypothetical protein
MSYLSSSLPSTPSSRSSSMCCWLLHTPCRRRMSSPCVSCRRRPFSAERSHTCAKGGSKARRLATLQPPPLGGAGRGALLLRGRGQCPLPQAGLAQLSSSPPPHPAEADVVFVPFFKSTIWELHRWHAPVLMLRFLSPRPAIFGWTRRQSPRAGAASAAGSSRRHQSGVGKAEQVVHGATIRAGE